MNEGYNNDNEGVLKVYVLSFYNKESLKISTLNSPESIS